MIWQPSPTGYQVVPLPDGPDGLPPHDALWINDAGAVSTSNPVAQPASGAGDYTVTATQVHELKNGLLFAGLSGRQAFPSAAGRCACSRPRSAGRS